MKHEKPVKYEDPDPIQPGEVKVGFMLWMAIIIGFLLIAGVVLAAMALLRP